MDNNNHKHDQEQRTNTCTCSNAHLIPYITKSFNNDHDDDNDDDASKTNSSSSVRQQQQPQMMDNIGASFVYIPTSPSNSAKEENGQGSDGKFSMNKRNNGETMNGGVGVGGGLAEVSKHLETLVTIASSSNFKGESDGLEDMPYLCCDCLYRVASAVQTNTKRLENECQAYKDAVTREEDQCRRVRRAIAANIGVNSDSNAEENGDETKNQQEGQEQNEDDLIRSTIISFQNEISSLQQACHQNENELHNIQQLLSEQSLRSTTLSQFEQTLLTDLNNLEIHSKAFSSTNRTLTKQYRTTQKEVTALSRISLPPMLFDVVIDDRGLRYPLVNELRLAYRPKGDLMWREINGAWSQAAQLLMFVGGVAKFVPREDNSGGVFRIEPLSSQAKIIHSIRSSSGSGRRREVVYTLGRDSSSLQGGVDAIATGALCAFHSLLYQLTMHVTSVLSSSSSRVSPITVTSTSNSTNSSSSSPPPPPFEISQTKIGMHDLSRLHERDDSGWSGVIHCMAANLKWLAEYSGYFTAN